MSNQFPTTFIPDSPTVQDASYRFSPAERARIDSQIIGLQQVVALIIAGALGPQPVQSPTSGGDVNYTIQGTAGIVIVPITALTAPRSWMMPTAPAVGMVVTVMDARRLYTATNKITLTTSGGTDHFWITGVDRGTSVVIDPLAYLGLPFTLVRGSATTWEMWQ